MTAAPALERAGEWVGTAASVPPRRAALVAVTIVGCMSVAIAAVVATLWAPLAGLGAGVVFAAGCLFHYRTLGNRIRRRVGATPVQAGEWPRFLNLVTGLAQDLAMDPPETYVIGRASPNAIVWHGRRPALAVTSGLLEEYSRTQLEAVVAHCVIRLRDGRIRAAMPPVWLGRWAHRLAPQVGHDDDVRAAAVTRYPPALASAIEQASPSSGAYAPLWFAGSGAAHRDAAHRAADVLAL